MTIRIIGLGSPFGADILGWQAIDLLQSSLPGCEYLKLDRPGTGLIEHFADVQSCILIDAIQTRGMAGDILELSLDELGTLSTLTSSHGFGVADSLLLASSLQQLPEHLLLLGIIMGEDNALSIDKKKLLEIIKKWPAKASHFSVPKH